VYLLHVTILAPKILRQPKEFWKICAPFIYTLSVCGRWCLLLNPTSNEIIPQNLRQEKKKGGGVFKYRFSRSSRTDGKYLPLCFWYSGNLRYLDQIWFQTSVAFILVHNFRTSASKTASSRYSPQGTTLRTTERLLRDNGDNIKDT